MNGEIAWDYLTPIQRGQLRNCRPDLPVKEPENRKHYNGKNEMCYVEAPRICDQSDWENCPFYERGEDGTGTTTF